MIEKDMWIMIAVAEAITMAITLLLIALSGC